MSFWIDFWTIFFMASLALFAIVAVVVSIGGFLDIRSLFKGLADRPDQQHDNRRRDAG